MKSYEYSKNLESHNNDATTRLVSRCHWLDDSFQESKSECSRPNPLDPKVRTSENKRLWYLKFLNLAEPHRIRHPNI